MPSSQCCQASSQIMHKNLPSCFVCRASIYAGGCRKICCCCCRPGTWWSLFCLGLSLVACMCSMNMSPGILRISESVTLREQLLPFPIPDRTLLPRRPNRRRRHNSATAASSTIDPVSNRERHDDAWLIHVWASKPAGAHTPCSPLSCCLLL